MENQENTPKSNNENRAGGQNSQDNASGGTSSGGQNKRRHYRGRRGHGRPKPVTTEGQTTAPREGGVQGGQPRPPREGNNQNGQPRPPREGNNQGGQNRNSNQPRNPNNQNPRPNNGQSGQKSGEGPAGEGGTTQNPNPNRSRRRRGGRNRNRNGNPNNPSVANNQNNATRQLPPENAAAYDENADVEVAWIKPFKGENEEIICELCGKPIRMTATAIRHRESGKPCHFDCVLKQLKDEHEEDLTVRHRKVYYIGAGTFAVVKEKFGRSGKLKSYTIVERIVYEPREN